jgi:hypothetical protein
MALLLGNNPLFRQEDRDHFARGMRKAGYLASGRGIGFDAMARAAASPAPESLALLSSYGPVMALLRRGELLSPGPLWTPKRTNRDENPVLSQISAHRPPTRLKKISEARSHKRQQLRRPNAAHSGDNNKNNNPNLRILVSFTHAERCRTAVLVMSWKDPWHRGLSRYGLNPGKVLFAAISQRASVVPERSTSRWW